MVGARPANLVSELRRVDPFVGAIGELLVFPDRQPGLDLVDQLRAGGEGLGPVIRGHRASEGDIPDLERTEATGFTPYGLCICLTGHPQLTLANAVT